MLGWQVSIGLSGLLWAGMTGRVWIGMDGGISWYTQQSNATKAMVAIAVWLPLE